MKDIGIYIHIPFCERKCVYCDFYSVVPDDDVKELYVNELITEIKRNGGKHYDKRVKTLYLGGGTPSLLTPSQTERILNAVRKYFLCDLQEATIEVNPNSSGKLREYAEMGINRLSVGVQSTDDRILKKLGRLHNSAQAIECLDRANEYFDNINADIMLGVDKEQNVKADLELILPKITHLSSYMLKVENKTPLKSLIRDKKIEIADEDRTVDMYEELYKICMDNGFYRYEVSNFSRLGMESKHNSAYWRMTDYLGFGASAHSYADGVRYFNTSDLKAYLNGEHSGYGEFIYERRYSLQEEKAEFIMLALRTANGLDIEEYNRRYNADFFAETGDAVKELGDFLTFKRGRLSIRPEFLLVQNSVIFELI